MGYVKFLAVPNTSAFDNPVGWDVQLLAEWLQHLSGSALDQSCEKICGLLLHLNQSQLEDDLLIQLLEEIATYVKLYETRVDSAYLDSSLPLPEYQQHCVEWLVWCYMRLAQGFYRVAAMMEDQEKKAVFLYRGLHSLIRAYMHISAVYCEPADGFWSMCYEGYASAEAEGLLDINCFDANRENDSINHLFKLLVVFSLCDLRQFRPREMRRIFDFLSQFANLLTVNRQPNSEQLKGFFVLNFHEDCQPDSLLKQPELQHKATSRFFAPASLAKTIYQALQNDQSKAGLLKAINKAVLMRVIKTLGQAQSRQYKRTKEQRQFRGIIGFANIRDYLHQEPEQPELKKQSVPKSARPYDYDTSQFEVVAEGDEVVFQMNETLRKKFGNDERVNKILAASGGLTGKIDVWDSKRHSSSCEDIDISEFAVLNSSAKGYGVAVNNRQAKVKVGDLFAVVAEGTGLELAIIRRIRRIFGDQLYLGVELIGVAKEVVLMQGAGQQEKQAKAIFLPAIKALKQPDTLIYSSAEFNSGEFVTLAKKQQKIPCRLNKLINSTASLSQVELFYPKIEATD